MLLLVAFGIAGMMSARNSNNVKQCELLVDVADESCTHISLSCGVSYSVCNFKGSIAQFLQLIDGQEKSVFGKDSDKDEESLPNLNG